MAGVRQPAAGVADRPPWWTSSRSSRLVTSTSGPSSRITTTVPGPRVAAEQPAADRAAALDGAVAPPERHRRVPREAGRLGRPGAGVAAEVGRDARRRAPAAPPPAAAPAPATSRASRGRRAAATRPRRPPRPARRSRCPAPPAGRPRRRGRPPTPARWPARTTMPEAIETPLTSVEKPSEPRSAVSSTRLPSRARRSRRSAAGVDAVAGARRHPPSRAASDPGAPDRGGARGGQSERSSASASRSCRRARTSSGV